jgi:GNAT superfamily N-acetyltransferase
MENITERTNQSVSVTEALTEHDILKCWDVMFALRPHLEKRYFVSTVEEMRQEGYRLVFIEEDKKVVAAIGFRYLQFLFNGKHFYIDDLSTLPEYRGKGYGTLLLNYVTRLAKDNGFKRITLDSGYQRNDAHRVYLNNGFVLASHHFSKNIE